MTTRLDPYLSFKDEAREAIESYHSLFGGELKLNTFADFQASEDPDDQDKIMHGDAGDARRDGPDGRRHPQFDGIRAERGDGHTPEP